MTEYIERMGVLTEDNSEIELRESTEFIEVIGAKQHNLKNINVSIPKNKLVVITGVLVDRVKVALHSTQFLLKVREDILRVYLAMLGNF